MWPKNGEAYSSTELPYWAATTALNSVVEFRQYSAEFGLPNPPDNLKMFVTNWGFARGTGSTVMFNKYNNYSLPATWVSFFLAKTNYITAGITALAAILKNKVDITISYLPADADYNCWLTSSRFKATVYHELGHAQHYSQVGCDFWTSYRGAIINELSKLDQTEFHPYGTGNDSANAPIIATGEMWGNHCEYIYSNRHFGNGGTASAVFTAPMQGNTYSNSSITGLTPYLAAIESHNPKSSALWSWIPQGLPYDLFDAVGENFPVSDNVVGYTYQQSFNALQTDVRSIPAFRNKLLQLNGNNQQIEVNALFNEYQ